MPKQICVEAVQLLYLYMDGELPAERRMVIALHLADCPPCGEAFEFEVALRNVIACKCREREPDGLRARVFQAIHRIQD